MRTPRPLVRTPRSAVLALFSLAPFPAAVVPAARAATAATIATYDFESGTQGWGPRGSGVSVATTAAPAHGGAGALLTTGRTATWNDPTGRSHVDTSRWGVLRLAG